MAQAALLAFIITMVLIQAGRMNIELDYDSLHYGLRSAYVLDNGKGIYENLGMINLVYTYSKGLEVLVLPLSGLQPMDLSWPFLCGVPWGSPPGSRYSGKILRAGKRNPGSSHPCRYSGNHEYGGHCKKR